MANKKTDNKNNGSSRAASTRSAAADNKRGASGASALRSSSGALTTRSASASRSVSSYSPAREDRRAPDEVRRDISGVVLIVIGLILGIFCYFGSSGLFAGVATFLFGLFGVSVYTLPPILIALGVLLIALPRRDLRPVSIACIAVIVLSVIALIHIFAQGRQMVGARFGEIVSSAYNLGKARIGGGVFGGILAYLFVLLLGVTGSAIALFGIIVIAILLLTHVSIKARIEMLRERSRQRSMQRRSAGANAGTGRRGGGLFMEELPTGDNGGFIEHSGTPLTSGDSDYSYDPPARTARRGDPSAKSGANGSRRRGSPGPAYPFELSGSASDGASGASGASRASGASGASRASRASRASGGSAFGGSIFSRGAKKKGDELEFYPSSGPLEVKKHSFKKKKRDEMKTQLDYSGEMFEGDPFFQGDGVYADVELEYGDRPAFGGTGGAGGADGAGDADDPLASAHISVYDPRSGRPYGGMNGAGAGGGADGCYNSSLDGDGGITPPETENGRGRGPASDVHYGDEYAEGEDGQKSREGRAGGESGESGESGEKTDAEAEGGAEEVYIYQRPPIELLKLPDPTVAIAAEPPEEKARVLIETLKSFHIEAKIVNISIGPVITRFELQPAQGVRVNKITALSSDIALALAAPRVRIEAPIPGKSAIGIEIPNHSTIPVLLRELIDTGEFAAAKSPLTFAVGKDIAGNAVYADLGKMPHMLVAGQTGSGKSVCINGIILSLVYKSSPKDVRMILIDPKVVELSIFQTLPHLFCPVVTEPKKAAGALKWAVNEMDQRYKRMAEVHARDIDRYNAVQKDENERWPRLVIIIDELADLMIVASKDVEESICRIAQLGRACGIHLIVATQRPSVDVITGLIKANIPSRIAFAVSNATDSRVILDSSGADKLLGRGDMLFHPNGASKPTRAQGAYVGDEEVEAIAEFFTKTTSQQPVFKTDMLAEISSGAASPGQGNGKQEDELLPDAVRLVIESGAASISMIQRRLRVGYARAARLVDIMEQKGYVSEADGSKPRKVLLDAAGYYDIFGSNISSGNQSAGGAYDDDGEDGGNGDY